MNGKNSHICLARASAVLATVGLLVSGSGCALPAIEGIFDDRDFAVFDSTPEARGQVGDEVLLVFADIDEAAATMRTVSIDLKAVDTLDVGVELEAGDDSYGDLRPSIDVVEGTLVTQEIAGNGTLQSVDVDTAKGAVSTGGTVVLDENSDGSLAGSFHVDLSDGGYLEGTFRSAQ